MRFRRPVLGVPLLLLVVGLGGCARQPRGGNPQAESDGFRLLAADRPA